jgi:hypothetical protein
LQVDGNCRKQSASRNGTFRDIAGVSDIDGTVNWAKTPGPVDQFYRAGFTEQLDLIGSAYVPPPTDPTILNFPDNGAGVANGDVNFLAGNLNPEPTTKSVVLSATNKISIVGSEFFSMSINPKNGSFSGKFEYPGAPVRRISFAGVVFQKQNFGGGLFRNFGTPGVGDGQTGEVTFDALP